MQNRIHTITDKPHIFHCELTDTFGGEANYSWVKRATVTMEKDYSELQLRRAIKAALGLTGLACDVTDYGDSYEFKPRGLLQIAFANFDYS